MIAFRVFTLRRSPSICQRPICFNDTDLAMKMPSVSCVIIFISSSYFCGFCFYLFFLRSNRNSLWTNLRIYCHLLAEDLRAYCARAVFTTSEVAAALMVAMLAYFGLSLVKHLVIRIADRWPARTAATTIPYDLLPDPAVDLETEETDCGKKEKYDRDPFCTDLNCVRCNKPSAALMKALDRIRSGMTEETTMEIKEAETWTRLKETVEMAMEEVKRKRTGRLYEYPGMYRKRRIVRYGGPKTYRRARRRPPPPS